jgi:hypothetical protein
MQTLTEATIEARAEQPYVGIRLWIPSKDLSTWTTKLLKELRTMDGQERGSRPPDQPSTASTSSTWGRSSSSRSGAPVAAGVAGDDRVRPGCHPGRTVREPDVHGQEQRRTRATRRWWSGPGDGVAWDRWDDPRGDAFRCRYESYLSDRLTDPDKATWRTNVAIKVHD